MLSGPTYFDHCGRRVYMKLLAAETGIPLMTLYQRWHRGDRDERLVRAHIPRSFSRNPLEHTHVDSTDR